MKYQEEEPVLVTPQQFPYAPQTQHYQQSQQLSVHQPQYVYQRPTNQQSPHLVYNRIVSSPAITTAAPHQIFYQQPLIFHSMDANGNPIPVAIDMPLQDIEAPSPFFIETPLDHSSLPETPQVDTTNVVIPPSLLTTQSNGVPEQHRQGHITPIVEEPDQLAPGALAQPPSSYNNNNNFETNDNKNHNNSNNSNNSSGGVLTLLKPIRSNKPKQPRARPAFITKLWTMVNAPENQELISWFEDGESFVVSNRENFVQQILPKYFKHSNFASFVRQLNMYGWHKVQDPSSNSLHSDERWQFTNPNFQRDRPELLDKIVRNKPQEENEEPNGASLDQLDVTMLIRELTTLKSNQLKITQELSRVRQDNDLLWQELYQSREKNLVQNEKVERILQFLSSIYGNNKVQVLEDGSVAPAATQHMEPYTHAYPPQPPMQDQSGRVYNKPRLMIQQRHGSNTSSSSVTTSNTPIPSTTAQFEVDNSPVQEILRTPSNTLHHQQLQQQHQHQQQQQQQFTTFTDDIAVPEENIYHQPPMPGQEILQPQAPQPQQIPQEAPRPSDMMPPRPSLQTNPSLDELTRTIEQQGHSINDIITRLQKNQFDQPQTFDLDEFLNEEMIPDDEKKEETKRGVRDEDDEEVEEIVNPSKKRKSGNY